jgi:hypothetical protein
MLGVPKSGLRPDLGRPLHAFLCSQYTTFFNVQVWSGCDINHYQMSRTQYRLIESSYYMGGPFVGQERAIVMSLHIHILANLVIEEKKKFGG